MEVQFQDKKIVASASIDVQVGSFALDATPLQFETCRERFGPVFTKETVGFFFKHDPGKTRDVATFILKTEAILKETVHSKFAETNRSSILWVEPSEFWKAHYVRRSLFTILLRCGNTYNYLADNYEAALFSEPYVVLTKRAIMRFMAGFTNYAGPEIPIAYIIQQRGWKSIFENKSDGELVKLLTSPAERRQVPSLELNPILWI